MRVYLIQFNELREKASRKQKERRKSGVATRNVAIYDVRHGLSSLVNGKRRTVETIPSSPINYSEKLVLERERTQRYSRNRPRPEVPLMRVGSGSGSQVGR